MAPASPNHSWNPSTIWLCAATLLALVLAGCSTGEAFIAADYAKCRELGFVPETRDYDVCLLEVQRRRTTLAAAPEQLRE
jgi:hypothetical protein